MIALRNDLFADQYCAKRIRLEGERHYTRNEKAVQDMASGLMKVLYPDGVVSDTDFYRHCVLPAVRLRQRIWDQLYLLDPEFRQYERELRCRLTNAD